ncbi:hypothetical protein DNTS_024146 [Danionella cerebrum]|uniref:LysM and putative peptidoglycan-binding domain-containing protein 2 n=1 Tax=Danionella cerebrum TaxID=2873325 RepID=A0A553RIH3_9TELE|nr:hypothetical protein DNTS_024146 [Danionella translucida]
MAEFSPILPPLRDDAGAGRYGLPLYPRSRSGSESDSELSQSLARTKTRSYGSTASVMAPLGEKYIEHRVADGETLQGIALRYGVTMEQIKRVNKLFSNDCIFLRNTLSIPVKSEKRSLFNGLSLESPDSEGSPPQESPCVSQDVDAPSPPPEPSEPVKVEELSAKDFLHRLDLQIKQSKQAARKLKEDGSEEDSTSSACYQDI